MTMIEGSLLGFSSHDPDHILLKINRPIASPALITAAISQALLLSHHTPLSPPTELHRQGSGGSTLSFHPEIYCRGCQEMISGIRWCCAQCGPNRSFDLVSCLSVSSTEFAADSEHLSAENVKRALNFCTIPCTASLYPIASPVFADDLCTDSLMSCLEDTPTSHSALSS